MSLAVRGNLRVAAAARTSFGAALQLGYRTGTITGMLTDGLGLLGGTVIFMAYGEHAYEVLLGFGFGGTLLALFMRVGGGIYTKAADVGADLVGKVEAGHPRGRPAQRRHDRRQRRRQRRRLRRHGGRHLRELRGHDRRRDDPGLRQLRPQGRDLPAAGPGHRRGRLDHQHLQRQGRRRTAPATRRCTRSTAGSSSARSSASSASSLLGLGYLHFDDDYIREYPQALDGYRLTETSRRHGRVRRPTHADAADELERVPGAARPRSSTSYQGPILSRASCRSGRASAGAGLDMRPAWTCLIGIILAIALNK